MIATRNEKGYEYLKKYNAMGENANANDKSGANISIFKTALRGLEEECGILEKDINEDDINIHSFIFDNAVQDYKFFGYCHIKSLTQEQIKEYRKTAKDCENKDIEAYPVTTKQQCLDLIQRMLTDQKEWARETMYCTLSSLLIAKADIVSIEDILNLIGQVITHPQHR